MMRAALLALGLVALSQAEATACERVVHDGAPFTVCRIDLGREEVRLFLRNGDGEVYGTFSRVQAGLPEGERLGIAMNAGMFHPDLSPVGLYVEEGREEMFLVTGDGPGNFGLLPNGVLCIGGGEARVIESRRFAEAPRDCRFATQSGPMLVIDGALHPRFLERSESLNIRNGVGVSEDGRRMVLAIADAPVNFHHFARLFRDRLGTPNALYLDGRVSRLHAPGIGRSDIGFPVGPIIGTVVRDAPAEAAAVDAEGGEG
ncbi:MAG: phosphodiester glycosidase family protein [Roseicyclus sp.]